MSLHTTGILQAKGVSNVGAIMMALLVETVMTLVTAHARPILVDVNVIVVSLITMVLQSQEGAIWIYLLVF